MLALNVKRKKMYTIREKVTEKLSRLFADSPNTSPSALSSPPANLQARPYSNGEKSFASFLSFVIPSLSNDGAKSNKKQPSLKAYHSLPVRRRSEDFDQQNELFENYEECTRMFTPVSENKQSSQFSKDNKGSTLSENKQTFSAISENKESPSRSCSSSESDVYEEATTPSSSAKMLTNLTEDSVFITSELYEFLQLSLPNIVKGCQWILLYSTLKHGISLRTLIRNSADLSGPCLLVVGDRQGAVFGGMLECPLKPTPKRKYQGSNQTFVFTTIHGQPRIFRPTGANRYYYMCLNDFLAFGGGCSFALRLDGDLLSGTSGPSETFGNLCLAHNPEFELKNVELWAFSHVSHYLT